MAITVCALGSGSKGNAVLVSSDEHKILIDCGFGIRELSARLGSQGVTMDMLEGVIITHEHTDHIKAIRSLGDKHNVPVYLHQRTCCALGSCVPNNAYIFSTLNGFLLGGFEVRPFQTSHDAAYPLGYSISDGNSRFVYATDLGFVSSEVYAAAKKADIVMLESNYDKQMLINGAYPNFLKKRILSNYGHLCNTDCATAVRKLADWGTKNFILGHISQENNSKELVYNTTLEALCEDGGQLHKDFELSVALQDAPCIIPLCNTAS